MIATAEPTLVANQFARIAWLDLYDYLRTASHRLNVDGSFDGLRIGSSDTLKAERPARDRAEVVLFLNTARAYRLGITFDGDLRFLRYTVDGDIFAHDLLAVSEGDTYGFRTLGDAFLTADEVGRSMLANLTSCAA